jgi:hypothetical protein
LSRNSMRWIVVILRPSIGSGRSFLNKMISQTGRRVNTTMSL